MTAQHVAAPAHGDEQNPGDQPPLVMFVQVRPRWAALGKFQAELDALLTEHADAAVSVAGAAEEGRHLSLTLAVDLGPRVHVARRSPQSQIAYAFVQSLFASMFNYLPRYVGEPSVEEREAAAALAQPAPLRAETPSEPVETPLTIDAPAPRRAELAAARA
jgi:hypothetical protein